MKITVKDFDDVENSVLNFVPINDEQGINKIRTETKQQKKRDKIITDLLKQYLKSYKNKVEITKTSRIIISITLGIILITLISTCVFITCLCIKKEISDWTNLIALISAYATLFGLIIGLLKIITKYIFPTDDEKYITEIVKAIQSNDLANKREDLQAYFNFQNKPK